MSGEKKTFFPGFGEVTIYYVGHPEPTTLPRYYPDLRNATCRGAIPGIDDVLRNYRLFGLTSDVAVDIPGGRIRPRDLAAVLLGAAPMPPADQLPPPHGGGRVIVRGRKDGIFEERQYLIIDPLKMSPNTGCAAAVGTAMMGRGQITTKGVFAPEGGVEPATFLRELAKLGFTWEETIIRKGSLSI
jgi:saccharopine dehydrogenase-like NADP-dependent oxidoreductase